MATASIGATARDFTTVALWEADLDATLTEQEIGELFNDSEFTSTATTTINVTTSGSNDIILRAAAGEGIADDADKATNALRYNASNGVGMRKTNNFGQILSMSSIHITLEGIQFKHDGATSATALFSSNSGSVHIFEKLIVEGGAANGTILFAGNNSILVNSLVLCISDSSTHTAVHIGAQSPKITNCTLVDIDEVADAAFDPNFGTPTVRNCAVFGFSEFSDGSSDLNVHNCVTDLSTINNGAGSDSNNVTSAVFADQFENTTTDFRLKAGSDCEGAATVETETDDEDIVEQTRDGTAPDSGCWEFQGVVDFTAELTASSFGMTAQALDVQADFNPNLSTASFVMVAQDIDVQEQTNIDLTTASFTMTAQALDIQADFNPNLSTAIFNMAPQDLNVNAESQTDLTTATFNMVAQDIDVEVSTTIELSTASFNMTALDIDIPDVNIIELSTPSFNMTGRTLFVSSGNVTRTQQGKRQLAFRIISGQFDNTYNGDVMLACLLDEPGIQGETFNGVLYEWLGLKGFTDDTLSGRMQAFAEAGGAFNWSSLGDFTI